MNIKIVSFHWDKIPDTVRLHQKMVFDHFGLAIEQVITGLAHYDAIDKWIAENEFDVMVLFDGDCIPLDKWAVPAYINQARSEKSLLGGIQNANHIKESPDYVSPGFMVLTNDIYNLIGRPSFHDSDLWDCGGQLSLECYLNNVKVVLLPVTHVMQPRWKLRSGGMFGIGTTYDHSIFHAFESRMNSNAIGIFEKKCLEVVNSK
jgi:hypothetical protein